MRMFSGGDEKPAHVCALRCVITPTHIHHRVRTYTNNSKHSNPVTHIFSNMHIDKQMLAQITPTPQSPVSWTSAWQIICTQSHPQDDQFNWVNVYLHYFHQAAISVKWRLLVPDLLQKSLMTLRDSLKWEMERGVGQKLCLTASFTVLVQCSNLSHRNNQRPEQRANRKSGKGKNQRQNLEVFLQKMF